MPIATSPPHLHDLTRERIIFAAGEIFAEEGYQAATVRAICEKAQVNIAAVNYHFRDKLGLYTEVLRESCVHDKSAPTHAVDDPGVALRTFIHGMMSRLLRPGYDSWRMHIMAREMAQPTPALTAVIEQTIRPNSERLRNIVSRLMGLPSDDTRVRRTSYSIVGQCMMYRIGAPVLKQLWPDMPPSEESIDEIAAHITAFSLHGIEGLTVQMKEQQ